MANFYSCSFGGIGVAYAVIAITLMSLHYAGFAQHQDEVTRGQLNLNYKAM